MEEQHAMAPRRNREESLPHGFLSLPRVTRAEREFWRRAVEAERRRQHCGPPAPSPFQPA